MMKNKSQLMLTRLFIAFGDAASAIAEPVRDDQVLPSAALAEAAMYPHVDGALMQHLHEKL